MKKFTLKRPRKKWSKKRKVITGIVTVAIVAAAGTGIFFYTRKSSTPQMEDSVSVSSATAETGSISTTVTGTGTIANGSSESVNVPIGIVIDEILVEEGDSVEEGDTLATVKKASVASAILEMEEELEDIEDQIDDLSSEASTEGTTEYYQSVVLNEEKEDLEDVIDALEEMLDSGKIVATTAGTIDSISVTEGSETAGSSGSSGSSSGNDSTGTNTSSTTTTASNTSTVITTSSKKTTTTATNLVAATSTASVMSLSTAETTDSAELEDSSYTETVSDENVEASDIVTEASDTDEEVSNSEETEEVSSTAIDSVSVNVTAPATGKTPQKNVSSGVGYTGTISWNTSGKFEAGTSYTATIVLTAKDGYVFSSGVSPSVTNAESYNWEVSADGSTLTITATFPETEEETTTATTEAAATTESSSSNSGSESGGDSDTTSSSGSNNAVSGSSGSSGSSTTGSASGTSGSSSSGSSSSSSSSDSDEDESTTVDYNSYGTTAFSIASSDEVVVSINVDELDISSISVGQTATITMDALEDEEFEGTITSVSSTASSSSSSSVKYPVEITLEKTDDMILGMSASATIYVEEAENAVLIPVSALQEKGNTTFVYTEVDEDGNLSGEVEVETGLSDSSQVEITSGLSEGDTVYYTKSESTDSDSNSMEDMMGGGQGGGEMPSGGGDMPSGGNGGGPGGNGGGN